MVWRTPLRTMCRTSPSSPRSRRRSKRRVCRPPLCTPGSTCRTLRASSRRARPMVLPIERVLWTARFCFLRQPTDRLTDRLCVCGRWCACIRRWLCDHHAAGRSPLWHHLHRRSGWHRRAGDEAARAVPGQDGAVLDELPHRAGDLRCSVQAYVPHFGVALVCE